MGDALGADGVLPGRRSSLRPLGGVLAAMAVSLTGTRVSAVALPWFVLVSTGSATQTGLVAFFETAPYVVVKALTGPLVDRVGPRTVSWTTDLASATAVAAVPLFHALHLLSFPLLLTLVAVVGAARGPGDLAKEVMVPEAAERGGVRLERATGLSGATERLASTVGPAAGGSLVALLGPLTVLVVNAGCFALGSVIIALALPRRVGEPAEDTSAQAGETRTGYWKRFGEGFAFLRTQPLLLTVIVMVGITNLLDAAFMTVLMPVWAKESGNGPAAIGLTGSAMGAAAVVGSLIAALAAHRLRRRLVFFAGFLLAGAPRFLILAVDAPPGAVVAVFAVSGFGAGFLNPVIGAVLLERVPRRLLGRVNALGDSLAWAGIPLGGLIAGPVVSSAGLVPVLLVCGAVYFLTTSLAGLRPEWREMDRRAGKNVARWHPGEGAPCPDKEATR
ncbi:MULTISPECIES: MFS transporter [unclassified Streptomyces]|uniref:MFS transporter n=1 Tax=unclassified Streptomyces TaxID=2593676 RepID=UPI002E785DC6|nr:MULTISPECIES: MFS transporter [unclassified Streptomyces]MEE1759789.1 MFS transporter [Streptomyces sp. SP18BB07]MEE1830182.1 MFS transporter [Streptomyces sp. SP17KL33]